MAWQRHGWGAPICKNKLYVIGHAAFCFGGSSSACSSLKHSGRVPAIPLVTPTSGYRGGMASPTAANLYSICLPPISPAELPGLKLIPPMIWESADNSDSARNAAATSALYAERGPDQAQAALGQAGHPSAAGASA